MTLFLYFYVELLCIRYLY